MKDGGRTRTDPGHDRGFGRALALALVIVLVGWFLASRSTLFDRDEPRFAQASVEMYEHGDWMVPTFDGELRADKPILVYWLMAQPMRLFGASAFTARLGSPVYLGLAALFLFAAARRLYGERAGLLAMGLLAVSPLAMLEGTIATTDALLLACITAATAIVVHAALDGVRVRHVVGLALALGAALLAKGPVGLAIPLLSALTAAWLARGTGTFDRRFAAGVAIATLAGVAAFLAWAVPANDATGGEFARRGIGHHVVARMSTPLESHGGNFFLSLPFYVPVVVFGFLPGMALLPAALSATFGRRLGGRRGRALILAWILPGFVLMSVVSTKLPHYVLPIWPGLALACAALVEAHERGETNERDRRWLSRGAWFLSVPAAILVVGLAASPWLVKLDGAAAPAFALAALLAATTFASVREHRRGRARAAAWTWIGGSAVAWIVGLTLAMPVVERTKVAPAIAAAIRARVPADVPVARWKFVEPSLDFYLNRPPVRDFETQAEFEAWALDASPAVLVIDRARLESSRAVLAPERYVEFASAHGFNLSKGKPLELVALARGVPSIAAPNPSPSPGSADRAPTSGEVQAAPPR